MSTIDLNPFFTAPIQWRIEEHVESATEAGWVRLLPPDGEPWLTKSEAEGWLEILRDLSPARKFRLANNAKAPVGALSVAEPSAEGRLSPAGEGGELSEVPRV